MFSSYYDFQLGNKKLSDFGGTLYNGENSSATKIILPQMSNQTEQLPLLDGSILYSSTYQPRQIPLEILINNANFDEAAFINWIKSKELQWFNYVGDTKKIQVVYEDEISMEMYNVNQSTLSVRFMAYDPYWYLINDIVFTKASPVVGTAYTVTNSGNDNSYPLVKLSSATTQSNVTFEINGKQFKISSMINDLYIDFYTETVYTINGSVKTNKISTFQCLNGKYKYEFGTLKVGTNTIKVTAGTLSSITVNCKSRFI